MRYNSRPFARLERLLKDYKSTLRTIGTLDYP